MIKNEASIPQLVRKYAEEWAEKYILGDGDQHGSLQKYVNRYLHDNIPNVLDGILGFERRFGDLRFASGNDAEGTIAQKVVNKMGAQLTEGLESILKIENFKFTPKEFESLNTEFRRAVMYKVQENLRKLAENRAQLLADLALKNILSDEEYLLLVENRLKGNTNGEG